MTIDSMEWLLDTFDEVSKARAAKDTCYHTTYRDAGYFCADEVAEYHQKLEAARDAFVEAVQEIVKENNR